MALTQVDPEENRFSAGESFLRAAVGHFLFQRWGVPVQRVLTDNGMAFRSRLFAEACLELGITQKFTRAYRPQTMAKPNGSYDNSDQRRQALPAWTHFYNWHRPHQGINLMPPCLVSQFLERTS